MQLETRIIEDDSGSIQLPVSLSVAHSSCGEPQAKVNITGVVKRWFSTEDWFSWEFVCEHPGEFDVEVTATTDFNASWDFGHRILIEYVGRENHLEIVDTGIPTAGFQKRTYAAGKIRIDTAGLHSISVKANSLAKTNEQGFTLSMVKLEPLKQ